MESFIAKKACTARKTRKMPRIVRAMLTTFTEPGSLGGARYLRGERKITRKESWQITAEAVTASA